MNYLSTKDRLNTRALETVKRIAETQIRYLDKYGRPTNYKLLTELIEDRFGERIWYRNSLPYYLGFFSPICKELKIPPLSATVVRKDSRLPGKGFAPWYKKYHPQCQDIDDVQLSRDLLNDAMHCQQWQVLLDYLEIDYYFKGDRLNCTTSSCPFFCPYTEEDFSHVVF